MNGIEFLKMLDGGKKVELPDAAEKIAALKAEYPFANYKQCNDSFVVIAEFDKEREQFKCMHCGEWMENRSKRRISNQLCASCGLNFIGTSVQTHTFEKP